MKLTFEVRGRGTKSAPPASFLSPCPVVYNFLRQLHTAGLHPLTILAAASAERNLLKSITVDPLRRRQSTILNNYLFKYKRTFVEIDKVIIDRYQAT